MAAHEPFRFKTLEELDTKLEALDLSLPLAEDVSILEDPVSIGDLVTPNRLVIHPMEGCDGTPEGKPDTLTVRRYDRFAAGGAGLLWFEATAVVPEARANPRQLLIVPENVDDFRDLVDRTLAVAREAQGPDFRPVTVLQCTHSGRYSRPVDEPEPILAHHDGVLDNYQRIPRDHPLITDAELDRLQDAYVRAASLAKEAGFDAVDIKSCHRYLLSELLAAHTRPGRYGTEFEDRTRFLLTVIDRIHDEVPGIMVATRLNIYDGHPYPWGWGVDYQDAQVPDTTEPLRLVKLLWDHGVRLLNASAGNPYFTPHINRPYDVPVVGGNLPEEHPLEGVVRILDLARQVQETVPEMVVIGSGYSWLRQFMGQVMAGTVRDGWCTMAGVGRGAFAYPDFAQDLLERGELDRRKCCITCSRCTQIMRDHGRTGCVIRDREVYGPIYKAGRE